MYTLKTLDQHLSVLYSSSPREPANVQFYFFPRPNIQLLSQGKHAFYPNFSCQSCFSRSRELIEHAVLSVYLQLRGGNTAGPHHSAWWWFRMKWKSKRRRSFCTIDSDSTPNVLLIGRWRASVVVLTKWQVTSTGRQKWWADNIR